MNPKEEKEEGGGEISSPSPSFRVGSPTTISAASALDAIQYSSSDDEFEFAALGDAASTAAEMFDNGRIRPVYPVFDRSLLDEADAVECRRGSLQQLFLLERGSEGSSSSSSEADELEGVPEGTYCVWTPKAKAEKCKKSGSIGSTTSTSSLRLKLRDLVIGRSNSDGKEKFLLVSGKGKRATTTGSNRKTFLPYKQDLVGFFSSVNSISRNHHPF